MGDAIRNAAQTLLDQMDADPGGGSVQQFAVNELRAALSAPQPTANERVEDLMRAVHKYGGETWESGFARGKSDYSHKTTRELAAYAAVDSAARALLLCAGQDEVAALQAKVQDMDKVLRSTVPDRHKGCTSPVGAVQSYIGELEQRLALVLGPDWGDMLDERAAALAVMKETK